MRSEERHQIDGGEVPKVTLLLGTLDSIFCERRLRGFFVEDVEDRFVKLGPKFIQ